MSVAEQGAKERLSLLIEEQRFAAIGEQNGVIKRIKGVISNSKPNPERLFVAEGLWAFKKLIEFSTELVYLAVCPDFIYTNEAVSAVEELSSRVADRFTVSAKTFEKLSERDKPDGLLALARLPQPDINDFRPPENAIILVLDAVEIPGNVGTMLRMADGAAVDAMFMVNRKVRLAHPKLVKGSMGAVLSIPVFEFESVSACRTWLYDHGFTVYLADTRATHSYFEEPFGNNVALIMGSERYGISREWYDERAVMISIPMHGSCDSLNVGVAATVLCYEASIKRDGGKRG